MSSLVVVTDEVSIESGWYLPLLLIDDDGGDCAGECAGDFSGADADADND